MKQLVVNEMVRRWEGFKTREPNGYYSYVWWETIIFFLLPIGFLITFILALFTNPWFVVLATIFCIANFYWTGRELKGREKYFDKEIGE